MTSAKYFNNWMKEAGRGHITAFLSWGLLILYGVMAVTQLSFDTQYTFFGIGRTELAWLCGGLGIALGLSEFFYLLQPKKQDFYYSLPVRKDTIFWSRYIHGIIHFLIPLILVLVLCGLYQGMIDGDFLPVAAGYTGRSILVSAGIFLIFYHGTILAVAICGNILSTVLTVLGWIFYFQLFHKVILRYVENYFITYYRITALEKLKNILTPAALSRCLAGGDLFDKREVLAYEPEPLYIAAAAAWILLMLAVFALLQKRRKPEKTGQAFVFRAAEQTVEFLLCLLGGLWICGFLLDVFGLAERNRGTATFLSGAAGAAGAAAIHLILEWILQDQHRKTFRRKRQLAAEGAAVLLVSVGFLAGAPVYDGFFPEPEELESISLCVNGVDMAYTDMADADLGRDTYVTDARLKEYTFSDDGMRAATAWAGTVLENEETKEDVVTRVTVCYHLKNGSRYRTYPVDAQELEAFSSVYETEEYKEKAYPVTSLDGKTAGTDRFTWSDGVTENVLKLTEDEKEALLDAYREDVGEMQMSDLSADLPAGMLKIQSELREKTQETPVYPFMTRTCSFLSEYGIPTEKTLADYPLVSVRMYGNAGSTNGRGESGAYQILYDEEEELADWKEKLVPQKLDLQPLLYPLDYSESAEAEIMDTETNSVFPIDCYGR